MHVCVCQLQPPRVSRRKTNSSNDESNSVRQKLLESPFAKSRRTKVTKVPAKVKSGVTKAKSKVTTEKDKCSVCLEALHENDGHLALLPCGHAYHPTCILGWMAVDTSCPVGVSSNTPINTIHMLIDHITHVHSYADNIPPNLPVARASKC